MESLKSVDALPEALGFVETPELGQLRTQLTKAIAAGSGGVRELATRYHSLAEKVVNQRKGKDYGKAQIGLIVQMGLIRRDGGNTAGYLEDLEDALTYAWNEQLEEVVTTLEAAITEAMAEGITEEADTEPTNE